jgi:hypothetical protein
MRRGEAWKALRERGRWMRLSERAVFLALLERSDNDDCSIPAKMTPSLVQLAESCCCSKSTAALALDHLAWHGWVDRTRTRGGRSHKTTYKLARGFECSPDRCDHPAKRSDKRSDSRTVSGDKRSDSRTAKRSDSHPENRRSTPVFAEGIREGEEREGQSLNGEAELIRADRLRWEPAADPWGAWPAGSLGEEMSR